MALFYCSFVTHTSYTQAMKYPNLRYGNPAELRHYAQYMTVRELAKRLRRSERSVRDWLSGSAKMPWWIPEIIRLQNLEHAERMRQMGMNPLRASLGLATKTAILYEFPRSGILEFNTALDLDTHQTALDGQPPLEQAKATG